MTEPVKFRRLFIDRPRRILVVETGKDVYHSLPGAYNPDAVFQRVKALGVIDLARWEPWRSE